MSDIIDQVEQAYLWMPNADKTNEGEYMEVGKDWLKKLIGSHNEQRVDFSIEDVPGDGKKIFIHGGSY